MYCRRACSREGDEEQVSGRGSEERRGERREKNTSMKFEGEAAIHVKSGLQNVSVGDNTGQQTMAYEYGILRDVFNLDAANVFAPRNDDVFRSVFDLYIAIWMLYSEITRVIPPTCKSLLVGLRILQVALHHHVASEHDFSNCLSICRDGLHVLGADDIELFQKYSLEQYYAIHLEVASMQSLGHRFPGIVRTQLRLSLEHIEVALDHSLTAANECPNKKAIVSAFRRTLTAFKTAPAIGIPKWASYKAGTFGATTAT
nr:Uncharacterised protein [Ipomoea batatas]